MLYTEKTNPKLPKSVSLRKYASITHLYDIIKYGVYASSLDKLNDPYEYLTRERQKTMKSMKVACFTTSKSFLMWSYYADSHKGCMVEFENVLKNNEYANVLKNVEYVEDLNIIHINKNKLIISK